MYVHFLKLSAIANAKIDKKGKNMLTTSWHLLAPKSSVVNTNNRDYNLNI